MNLYINALPGLLAFTDSADSGLATLLMAAVFPVFAALAVFVALRRASKKRKILTFFITLPLFVLPCVFVFTDLTSVFASLLGPGFTDTVPNEAGLCLAAAYGIVYLGLTGIICAGRVTKTHGIVIMFSLTLVFSAALFYLSFVCIDLFTGTNTAHIISSVLPFISGSIGDISVSALIISVTVLYIPLLFLCFLANRRASDLKAEDIVILHRIEEKEQQIEKEGICEFCRFSVPLEGSPDRVICDFKGETDRDGRCRRFEYDPLKRQPEPGKTPRKN